MRTADQPSVHVTDIGSGKMRARLMFRADPKSVEVESANYLDAARALLRSVWPGTEFRKVGWSANASEAIYHFARAQA